MMFEHNDHINSVAKANFLTFTGFMNLIVLKGFNPGSSLI